MRRNRVPGLLVLGILWLGCQTSLDATEHDGDYESPPVEDETRDWADDDINR